MLSVDQSLNIHIYGRFGSISRHLRGTRFKVFSNHGGITAKLKLLGEEIKILEEAVGKQFPPKYSPFLLLFARYLIRDKGFFH